VGAFRAFRTCYADNDTRPLHAARFSAQVRPRPIGHRRVGQQIIVAALRGRGLRRRRTFVMVIDDTQRTTTTFVQFLSGTFAESRAAEFVLRVGKRSARCHCRTPVKGVITLTPVMETSLAVRQLSSPPICCVHGRSFCRCRSNVFTQNCSKKGLQPRPFAREIYDFLLVIIVAAWGRVGGDQRSYSTPGLVSTCTGDRLRMGKSSLYVTSHPAQLSLAIRPWVGAMRTSVIT